MNARDFLASPGVHEVSLRILKGLRRCTGTSIGTERHGVVAAVVSLVAIVVLFTSDVATQSPGDVIVNFGDVRQRIDGFGASDFDNPALTDLQADLFFSATNGIGLSLLR